MKALLLVAAIVGLVAAAAWALTSRKPADHPYDVEIRDVAGEPGLVVVPEIVAAVPGTLEMPVVVSRANLMPEVVVHPAAPSEFAGLPASGSEALN